MSNRGRASRSSSASGIKDIGVFVENYRSLLDKLFPVLAVWDIVLYVARYLLPSDVSPGYLCDSMSPGGRTTY